MERVHHNKCDNCQEDMDEVRFKTWVLDNVDKEFCSRECALEYVEDNLLHGFYVDE
jgi:hypothetical protein